MAQWSWYFCGTTDWTDKNRVSLEELTSSYILSMITSRRIYSGISYHFRALNTRVIRNNGPLMESRLSSVWKWRQHNASKNQQQNVCGINNSESIHTNLLHFNKVFLSPSTPQMTTAQFNNFKETFHAMKTKRSGYLSSPGYDTSSVLQSKPVPDRLWEMSARRVSRQFIY